MRVLPPFSSAAEARALVESGGDEVRVVDCRSSLDGSVGRHTYVEGHLPGAVYADLDADLASPASAEGGRHPLPTPADFAATMGRLGIGDDTAVLAYDTAGGAHAGRLVWMLRILGQAATVLDGGLAAWDGPLEDGDVRVDHAVFAPRPWPVEALASIDEVDEVLAAGGLVVDARAAERYRGEVEPLDPRAGHVPGAVNVPYAGNLTDDGRLRPAADLRARFVEVGAGPDADAVVYCGSGVTACHDALVMEHVGLGLPRVFVGSWSAWSADPDRPAATSER